MSSKSQETIERLKEIVEGKSEEEDAEQEALLEESDEEAAEVGDEPQDEEEGAAEQKSSTREYVLLESTGKGAWIEVGRAVSATPEGALRTLGEQKLKDGTEYVAVPIRSWNPAPASVKTTTTISFS